MSKKSKLAPSKKVQNRVDFLDENYDFFQFDLWDKSLLDRLLALPIDDEDLYDLCASIEYSFENSWNEGFTEATDTIRAVLKGKHDGRPTYTSRRAVIESDND